MDFVSSDIRLFSFLIHIQEKRSAKINELHWKGWSHFTSASNIANATQAERQALFKTNFLKFLFRRSCFDCDACTSQTASAPYFPFYLLHLWMDRLHNKCMMFTPFSYKFHSYATSGHTAAS